MKNKNLTVSKKKLKGGKQKILNFLDQEMEKSWKLLGIKLGKMENDNQKSKEIERIWNKIFKAIVRQERNQSKAACCSKLPL